MEDTPVSQSPRPHRGRRTGRPESDANGVVDAASASVAADSAAALTGPIPMKHSYGGGHRAFGVVGVFLVLLCSASVLLAQEVVETKPGQRNGYTVRKADDKFVNAVDDFARYRDKKEWEKAFRSLTSVLTVDPKLMAPSKDG